MGLSITARRVIAVIGVIVGLGFAIPRYLTHMPYPRLGVTLIYRPGQDFPKVDQILGPPATYILERGDELRGIDGIAFSDSREMDQYLMKNGWPRSPFTLTINRTGRVFNIVVPEVQLGAWMRLRQFLFPVAVMVAAPLVALLLVWRRPDLASAWAFFAFASLQALELIWSLYLHPQFEPRGAFATYLRVYEGLILWYPAVFLHFMAVFPRPRWDEKRRWHSWWFRVVVAAYLVPIALLLTGNFPRSNAPSHLVFELSALGLGVAALMSAYIWPRAEWRPSRSERALALAVGVVLMAYGVLNVFSEDPRILALFAIPSVRVLFTAIYSSWLVSPLVIAYMIANDPLFDPRRLFARSLPYALLSGVLGTLYLGIVLLGERLFAAGTGEEALTFNVIAALVVAFAFAPLRERLQRALDRIFGRDPRALRAALDEAGRELLSALDPGQVRESVSNGLQQGLQREVSLEWPEGRVPRLSDPEEVPEEARPAVNGLLSQAAVRLENLRLQDQQARAERLTAELSEAATRAELRALHAQVQPHFVFNALNALSYLIETDAAAAQRFTERLADMLRYTVAAGERPAALLSEEISFVEDFLAVARERYENPLSFEFRGCTDLLSVAVPPLLLQPLVENSLKHGIAQDRSALHLSLEAEDRDGRLDLRFHDDGVSNGNGRPPGVRTGLANLEQRLRRFAGPDATLTAQPAAGGGFEVRLQWKLAGTSPLSPAAGKGSS